MQRPSAVVRAVALTLAVLGCAGCDLATKRLAQRHLSVRPPISLVGGIVHLTYAENPGAFLSLGATLPPVARTGIFVGIVGVVIPVMFVLALKDKTLSLPQVVAMGLVVGGGIGNLADRIRLGIVRDFMIMGIGPVHTGVFNVADMGITFGALAMIGVFLAEWIRARGSRAA